MLNLLISKLLIDVDVLARGWLLRNVPPAGSNIARDSESSAGPSLEEPSPPCKGNVRDLVP
jgi:hypothetical protein